MSNKQQSPGEEFHMPEEHNSLTTFTFVSCCPIRRRRRVPLLLIIITLLLLLLRLQTVEDEQWQRDGRDAVGAQPPAVLLVHRRDRETGHDSRDGLLGGRLLRLFGVRRLAGGGRQRRRRRRVFLGLGAGTIRG